jgi:hypothetical protein
MVSVIAVLADQGDIPATQQASSEFMICLDTPEMPLSTGLALSKPTVTPMDLQASKTWDRERSGTNPSIRLRTDNKQNQSRVRDSLVS